MKISIIFSILLVVVAAAYSWTDHRKLDALTADRVRLAAEGAKLGINFDREGSADRPLVTRLRRRDKEMDRQAKQLAADFLEYGVQREKRTAGISEGQAGELERRMLALNPGELAAFITELMNGLRTAGSEEGWGVYQSLALLAESDPQAALRIFRENSDFQKDGKLWKILIPEMLVNLASTDPIAAVRWQKEILGIQPDLIGYFTESGMVAAVAEKGLAPAFQMIRELELKNPERALGSLVKTIRTPEQRTEFVGLFRDFMRTEQGSKSRDMGQVMLNLSEAIGREGADAGGKWIRNYFHIFPMSLRCL